MFELIFVLGIVAAVVLAIAVVGFTFNLFFEILSIPFVLAWGVVKVVGAIVLGLLALIVLPVVIGPLLVVALVLGVLALPLLLLAAAGAAICGIAC